MAGFDIRAAFGSVSQRMLAEFQHTSQIAHQGGKGATREGSVHAFLQEYLPKRYSIGSGEVLHWSNVRSRQCDVVVFDGDRCPRLLVNSEYSIYPLESVFACVEVKSVLTSSELTKAFENIASVKRLVPDGTIAVGGPGVLMGMHRPLPIGAVFAYAADRSMQAVLDQYAKLEAGDRRYSPDLVAVLGEGIILRPQLRGANNAIDVARLSLPPILRRAGKHALLYFYLEFLQQLNALHLEALDLRRYLQMPSIVDGHRVRFSGNPLQFNADGSVKRALRITASGVKKVLEYCSDRPFVTYSQMLAEFLGKPVQFLPGEALDDTVLVKVFNPNDRKLFEGSGKEGRGPLTPLLIDDVEYQVDLGGFDMETDFEEDPDPDLTELFSVQPSNAVPGTRKK